MTATELVERLKREFGDKILASRVKGQDIWITVDARSFKELVRYLVGNEDVSHISTITGMDTGENIEVIYHLWSQTKRLAINVAVILPKDNPSIETVTDLIPGAALYEREVHDLVGVTFKGNPDLRRLVLPDEWPEEVYPLRREYKVQPLR